MIEKKIIIKENQKIRRGKMQNRNHQKYYLKNKFNIQEKKKKQNSYITDAQTDTGYEPGT